MQWGGPRALRLGWDTGLSATIKQARGRELRLGQTRQVAARLIAHLGSCHLGKYSWEIAAWENAFVKVS